MDNKYRKYSGGRRREREKQRKEKEKEQNEKNKGRMCVLGKRSEVWEKPYKQKQRGDRECSEFLRDSRLYYSLPIFPPVVLQSFWLPARIREQREYCFVQYSFKEIWKSGCLSCQTLLHPVGSVISCFISDL